MKRIVDGVTYNTATAARVASQELEYNDPSGRAVRGDQYIMLTRGGAVFLAFEGERWSEAAGDWLSHGYVETLSSEEARKLLEKGEWEIHDESFAAFPEAAAEPEEAATLYVRMPASLKRRIDERAKAEGVSANTMATRCMERCLSEPAAS